MSTKKMRTVALTALAVPALIGSVMAAPAQAEVQSGTNLTYTSPQNGCFTSMATITRTT